MDVVMPKICEKHKLEANKMCTKFECFQEANILICPECSSRHFDHKDDIIQISLLNEKVHELMKKRREFEISYDKSCQALINELKKFKAFKEEIVTGLNIRERLLNDLCKKIRRNIPYQKDKQLFKSHFGYVYLTMKGINPNLELYSKFRHHITETISSCRKSLHKFELNCGRTEITGLLKKQEHISSILKKTKENESLKYYEPTFTKFKKEIVKFSSQNMIDPLAKMMRVNNQEFLFGSGQWLSWYNASNCLFPKAIPMGRKLADMTLLDKNLFITTQESGIIIYDLLNEKILKQFASSNHKNASITGLLSMDTSTVLNFITCPNQIVSLRFNEDQGSLKVVKGVETKSKHIDSTIINDNFIALFDDKIGNLYKAQHLQKQREIHFDELMKSVAKINDHTFTVGGQCQYLQLIDTRSCPKVGKVRTSDYCRQIKKIYPYGLLASCGKSLKIYDLRMQQELFSCKTDETIRNLEVLTSELFITAGSTLNIWSSIS